MITCYNCFKEKTNNEETCPQCGYTPTGEMDEHYYLPEGTVLNDRYKIGRVLGHGGFGITYVGYDQRLEVIVAVKEYLPSEVATRALGEVTVTTFSGEKKEQYDYGLGRFLDEARTLARYNHHPCIVSTTDFFETNNTAYLVMEFLDGIPLNEYLKRKGGRISWDETLEIMMPVMDALREVHSSGMIHRDVSPDNIYITKDGQVKLLDFGAARFALGEKSKSLSVVLKPGYAPPEQYSSRGKQGPWTDVYAVAATMYRMVAGKNLLEAVDRYEEPELDFPDGIDDRVFITMEKALAIKGEDRYQKIDILQKALRSIQSIEESYNISQSYHKIRRKESVLESREMDNKFSSKTHLNRKTNKWVVDVANKFHMKDYEDQEIKSEIMTDEVSEQSIGNFSSNKGKKIVTVITFFVSLLVAVIGNIQLYVWRTDIALTVTVTMLFNVYFMFIIQLVRVSNASYHARIWSIITIIIGVLPLILLKSTGHLNEVISDATLWFVFHIVTIVIATIYTVSNKLKQSSIYIGLMKLMQLIILPLAVLSYLSTFRVIIIVMILWFFIEVYNTNTIGSDFRLSR